MTIQAERSAEDRAWIEALRADGREREQAAARLHAVLLRAARFELMRRRTQLEGARSDTLDELAIQSADSALVAILGKLEDFRYAGRFTTWAYKFAILEAGVLARRRAWQERELPVDPQAWSTLRVEGHGPAAAYAVRERLREVMRAIQDELSPHQREVLGALVLADVPIDVLAERLNTSRGAIYKTLHDARRKLRAALGEDELG
jgi:RNA polymerase sigma-70 factor (ECF subfamily)